MYPRFRASFFIAHLIVVPLAYSQEGVRSCDDAVQLALDSSPLVIEIEARKDAAVADALDARVLPNPQLDAQLGIPSAWDERRGDNEVDIAIEQPIRLSHGPMRNRLAGLIESAGSYERERQLLELVTKTQLACAQATALMERRRVLTEMAPRLRALGEFVNKGVNAGAYGKGDEAVFRSASAQIESELKGASAALLLALGEVTKLTGIEMQDATLKLPAIAPFLRAEEMKERVTQGATQFHRRINLLAELAEADAAVARRDAFPEFRPRLSFSRTNEGTDIVGIGLSFDLPLYSQNSAERIRKEGERSAAQAKANFARSKAFQGAVLKVIEAFSLRTDEVLLYQNRVLPALSDALKAYENQVRTGQGSIFALWQTSREYIDAHERYLELWARAFGDRIELEIMLEEEI